MRLQFISISEYLRHFYAIVQRSGVQEAVKIEKIHHRLDQKLEEITRKKRSLADSSASGAGTVSKYTTGRILCGKLSV